MMILEIGCTLGAVMTIYSLKEVYNKVNQIVKQRRESIEITDKQMNIGYQVETHEAIIIDMGVTPHMLVVGLSQTGKSRMIEYAIKEKNVILLNVFKEDFKTVRSRRINNIVKIKQYLRSILNEPYKRDRALYLVIDEMLVLCNDKEIVQLLGDVLAIGRHYNIFLIGICQNGTKEVIKFKDLFNVRVCFKMVEDTSYRAVLGYTPNKRDIKNRQFYVYSDKVTMGYTYDV